MTPTRGFAGKAVIVTGAGSGIGRAIAERFVAEGALVAACDISMDSQVAGVRLWEHVDVADEVSVDGFVGNVVDQLHRLDAVINVAGVGIQSDHYLNSEAVTSAQWQRVLDVNLTGSFLVSRASLRHLVATRGAIVNLSSVYGLVGSPGTIAYTASKHGVIGLTKGMALEYASAGVRVNAVCPGFVSTPMVNAHLTKTADPRAALKNIEAQHPIGRIARPEEIADAVLWLSSDAASFVTGTAIAVDGGFTAQ